MKRVSTFLGVFSLAFALSGMGAQAWADDSPTPTPTDIQSATSTLTSTDVQSATSTLTPTLSSSATFTTICSPTSSSSVTPDYSPTPTFSVSQTYTSSPTFSVSPTLTASPSASPTATVTPTPGTGSYTLLLLDGNDNPARILVPGNTSYQLKIEYTAANNFAAQGSLWIQLSGDIGLTPNSTTITFPTVTKGEINAGGIIYPSTMGGPIEIPITSLSAGQSVVIQVGYGSGFTFNGTTETELSNAVQVYADVNADGQQGGLVATPGYVLPVESPTDTLTVTPTFTASPTFSASQTFTISPTPSITPTATATPTNTPVGPAPQTGFYTYPNPYDKRVYSLVTVRFPPTNESVSVEIFNLAGLPVRALPASDIQNTLGVASWKGEDDYGRQVAGGLYFVRLKTPGGTWVRKMTVLE